ncbi:nuclease SbcCD subunit D [Gordoniibacillus kamchatkensis]|uniref:Nuclease SbcCD subunit D n=1 Tax=Gordoniibacillus kamchatkensis TaxID=1590651 RepID=A0ABR5AB72_9BACL|nr:exonuclease SbcCD subunit D [Paenibacillus sp. VKM B-2647]KIL38289.1 nuclease SbcCD subunit D [Paenibacillus sp. VKM B-2647]
MRILHTADWHFGRTLEGRSRLEEQAAFMDELTAIVREERIDLVLVAGDVYDSVNPPAAAEKLFYEGVSRLAEGGKRPVAIIAGNHDHPERLAASAPLAGGQGVTLVGLPAAGLLSFDIARTGERALMYALPYPSESRLGELLEDEASEEALRSAYSERIARLVAREAAAFRPDSVNLLMSHLYVLGGAESDSERPIQVGGAYTVDTSALCAGAQYVALGHLHRPQTVKAPSLLRYCGSPLAYSFSEAGQAKSVTVVDVAPGDKTVQPQEIWLSSGRPLVRWKATEGLAQVRAWLDEGRDPNAWIELEVHVTEAMSLEDIHELRKRRDGLIHIRPVYPQTEAEAAAAERQAGLPVDELFRIFYARQTGGAQPEPELVELFLKLMKDEDESEAAS